MCSAVLERAANDETLPPTYYQCPKWCGERKETRDDFCSSCPVGIADKEFEKETRALLDLRLGDKWEEYGFDGLLDAVYNTSYLQDTDPSKWTAKTERMVTILRGEKNRLQRTKDYKRPEAT